MKADIITHKRNNLVKISTLEAVFSEHACIFCMHAWFGRKVHRQFCKMLFNTKYPSLTENKDILITSEVKKEGRGRGVDNDDNHGVGGERSKEIFCLQAYDDSLSRFTILLPAGLKPKVSFCDRTEVGVLFPVQLFGCCIYQDFNISMQTHDQLTSTSTNKNLKKSTTCCHSNRNLLMWQDGMIEIKFALKRIVQSKI